MNKNAARWFALPIAWLFGLTISLRNWLYNKGFLKGYSFDLPVIAIGNLSTGGTGKSPMTLYLTKLLKEDFRTAILSRGYKRKTKGLVLANQNSTALDVGDEPLLFKKKHPDITVAVRESRAEGIPELLMKKPHLEVILLDDAFQHRSLQPGLNILLSDYHQPFYEDYLLPVGNLREWQSAYKRADVIVVTKCPPGLKKAEKQEIIQKIKPLANQKIYFSHLEYGYPYLFGLPTQTISYHLDMHVMLLTGIANPESLEDYVLSNVAAVYRQYYPDHHYYSAEDLSNILQSFNNIESTNKIIVTTEKDAMRLALHQQWRNQHQLPIYVQPVQTAFDEQTKMDFNANILSFVNQYFDKEYRENKFINLE